MDVMPSHLQGQPHQVRPMRTPAQILGGFVGGSFPAPASANKGASPNPKLAGAFPTDSRDEWRRTGHDYSGSIGTYFRDKAGIEGMDAVFSSHWVRGLSITHQEHKKSADLHQAAESPWRFLVREIALSHIDPVGSRHLAVSNDRLPDPVYRIAPDA
jgi:hypothetical protein